MTLVDQAIKEWKERSPMEQNRIAKWLIEELKSESKWEKSFAESEDLLEELAAEALEEDKRGETTVLDPERL
jgi:hypothetical protein